MFTSNKKKQLAVTEIKRFETHFPDFSKIADLATRPACRVQQNPKWIKAVVPKVGYLREFQGVPS